MKYFIHSAVFRKYAKRNMLSKLIKHLNCILSYLSFYIDEFKTIKYEYIAIKNLIT